MINKIKTFIKENIKIIESILIIVSFLLIITVSIKIIRMIINVYSFSCKYGIYNECADFIGYRVVNMIKNGINPYKLEILNETTVPLLYQYSISTPFFVAIISNITGLSIIETYYIFNFVLVLLTSLNAFIIIKDTVKSDNKIVNLLIYLSLFIISLTYCANTNVPLFNHHVDTIGIFITSLIFVLVYKNKENIILISILTVFILLTKQLLLIMALPLFIFLLISDKKLAWKYFTYCILFGIATVILMQIFFPLYWTESFYSLFSSCNNGTIDWALRNLSILSIRYFPFILILIYVFIYIKKNNIKFENKNNYNFYLLLNIIICIIPLLYIAQNGFDGLKYCMDVIAFSLMSLTYRLSLITINSFEYNKKKICYLFVSFILVISTFICYNNFDYFEYTKNDEENVTEFYNYIDQYKDKKIYLGINATTYIVNNNLYEQSNIYFNDGHLYYFNEGFDDIGIFTKLFYKDEIIKTTKDYVNKLNDMVANKEFDIVAEGIRKVIDNNVLQENYYLIGTYLIRPEINDNYYINVYLPKND